jgi:hypothetical protein
MHCSRVQISRLPWRIHLISPIAGDQGHYTGEELLLESWMRLATDTTLLGLEAQSVIGLRLAQLATGQGTPAEAQLMMTEKMLALMDAATTIAAGGSAHTIVEDYRKRVQANARRLRAA